MHDSQKGAERPSLPHGSSSKKSNAVLEHLRLRRVGGAAIFVCLYMHRQTFGNAGFQAKKGMQDPGLWCDFKVSAWAAEIPCDPDSLVDVRRRLEACKIIFFEPTGRGTGRIGWNVNFSEWQRYDHRGGARGGSGAPKGNQNASKSIKESTGIIQSIGKNNQNTGIIDELETIKTPGKSIKVPDKTIKTPEATCNDARNHAVREGAEEWEESSLREETSPNGDASSATHSDALVPLFPFQASHTSNGYTEPAQPDPLPQLRPAPSPKAKRASKPRKLSDEALSAHNEKAAYISRLVAAVQDTWGSPLPTPKAQRQGAVWFYALPGGPAPLDDVVACFTATLPDPFFAAAPPTMTQLQGRYSQWLRGKEGYTKAMLDKAARTRAVNQPNRKPSQPAGADWAVIPDLSHA